MTLRPDVSIVTTGHDVADARLHREAAALLRAGLVVEVLGLGDPSAGPKGASVRAAPRTGMLRRTARALVWPWRASGRVLLTIDPETVPSALLATPGSSSGASSRMCMRTTSSSSPTGRGCDGRWDLSYER